MRYTYENFSDEEKKSFDIDGHFLTTMYCSNNKVTRNQDMMLQNMYLAIELKISEKYIDVASIIYRLKIMKIELNEFLAEEMISGRLNSTEELRQASFKFYEGSQFENLK